METLLDISSTFINRHRIWQIPQSSKSLLGDIIFKGNIQYLSVLQLQFIRRRIRHSHHIKIGMHGIIAHIVLQKR